MVRGRAGSGHSHQGIKTQNPIDCLTVHSNSFGERKNQENLEWILGTQDKPPTQKRRLLTAFPAVEVEFRKINKKFTEI
ncbi:hypothetical protein BWK47_01025 [Synechocystis sp. CACIAM 05]|nr:hypothetical protein BWK47_01025 [Synechocystis sp. CACIAM 05]